MQLAARQLVFLSLALGLIACKDKGVDQPAAATAAAKVATIGAALSLTGAAASYGAQQRAGMLAAADEINQSGSLPLKLEADSPNKLRSRGGRIR